MRRVDAQVDGQVGDALVGAGDAIGLILDLFSDLGKVHELLSFAVKELAVLGWSVHELQDQRPPCDDATTSR